MEGKLGKWVGVMLITFLIIIPATVGNVSAEEDIKGKCSITIDGNKHVGSEKMTFGTGECKQDVRGWYFKEVESFMVDGEYSKLGVENEEKFITTIPDKGKYEVTIYTVPPKVTGQLKAEKPVEMVEVKVESKEGKEDKKGKVKKEEPKKDEPKKDEPKKEEPKEEEPKEEEANIYTVDEMKELREEGRLGFSVVDMRYFIIVDNLLEQEISEEEAIELGYIEDENVKEDIEYIEDLDEENFGEELFEGKVEEKKSLNIYVILGIVIAFILGVVYAIVSRNGNKKE